MSTEPYQRVEFPVENYYGTPYVEMRDGKFVLAMDDYSGETVVEISPDFYAACLKEFGDAQS